MQLSEQNAKELLTFLPYLYNVLFNYSLPDGIQEQNILQLDHFYSSVVALTARVGNQMGADSTINMTRKISSFIENVEIPEPKDHKVKVTRDIFNGVPVIVHTPTKPCKRHRQGLVFFHGGGWTYRTPETYFKQTVHLAKHLGAVVVSVDYRRSPEYRYPIPIDDCLKATYYFMENANRYFVNPDRIGIIGDSAGASMAASISLIMRDEKRFMPKTQVLIYPAVQMLDLNLPSYLQNDNIPQLSKKAAGHFLVSYTGMNSSFIPVILNNRHICGENPFYSYIDLAAIPKKYRRGYTKKEHNCDPIVAEKLENIIFDPYIFPLMAITLSNLPPALILTGEYDVLRDDGLIYGFRLRQEGVDIEEHLIEGGFHGMFDPLDRMKIGNEVMDIIVKYLKKKL